MRALIGLGVLAFASADARAAVPPWTEPGDLPLPADAHSVRIVRGDEPLRAHPSRAAERRGSAAWGALLPLYGAARGPGCADRWLLVGPHAWVCQDLVEFSSSVALAARDAPEPREDGLPHHYYYVGRNGSLGYASLRGAEDGAPDMELQPGFAVAVVRVEEKPGGESYALTTHGLWLPMRDIGPVRSDGFHGEEISDGRLGFGWVVDEDARIHATPNGRRVPGETHVRFERVDVLETATRAGKPWLRIGEGRWLSGSAVRAPTPALQPTSVHVGERWIDVELQTQVLTAYEGEVPVFATLVSTGKGPQGSELLTPPGEHRIWVKLRTSDMDNLDNDRASSLYAIQDVPWVMFFDKGYGLHGTFWHHKFGHPQSHGCVNLTPVDAQRLFHWTSPKLPVGWSAVLPGDDAPGTLVRVR